MFSWIKPWLYSKKNILFYLLIILKKKKNKNIIIYLTIESKNIFYFEYLTLIKIIKNSFLENLIKINKNKIKKNIEKIKMVKIIIYENNLILYKIKTNNFLKKNNNLIDLLINKIFWKNNIRKIIIIILIIIKIKNSNILINNNKKVNITYKICGKIIKKINLINIQQIENLIKWKNSIKEIINIFYLYIIKRIN